MRRKKVLIVSPCILPIPAVKGGAVLTLIESIVAQNEIYNKMDLTVVGSYNEEAAERAKKYKNTNFIYINGLESYELKDSILDSFLNVIKHNNKKHQYLWKIRVIREVKKILLSSEYDRIILQNSGYLLNVLKDSQVRKKVQGKVFYHLHNDIPDNVNIDAVKECNLLLISKYLLTKVNDICKNDMEPKSVILRNGFNVNLFLQEFTEEEKCYIREKLGIEKNKKVIIYTGRINKNKGISELVSAFTKINRDDLVLLIVGSHNFGSKQTSRFEIDLKEKISKLGKKIVFTGFVPYNEIWKYYRIADLAVLPSVWEEPAGLTMLEAVASKVPLITTYSGGIPEYLPDDMVTFIGRDNLIKNIETEICNIVDHLQDYSFRTEKACEYVINNYSEEKYYNNLLKALE